MLKRPKKTTPSLVTVRACGDNDVIIKGGGCYVVLRAGFKVGYPAAYAAKCLRRLLRQSGTKVR